MKNWICILFTVCAVGVVQAADDMTTLRVTFEKGLTPDISKAPKGMLRHGKATLTPGRGGKVLDVGRFQTGVAYDSGVLNMQEGTLEFWFASRHDPKLFKGKEHPAYTLWCAEMRNATGISSWISWNRQLVFRTASGYKNLTRIDERRHPLNDGRWHHLAYTWSDSCLAVFIDGTLCARSPGPVKFPPRNNSALLIGYRSGDEKPETREPVANPGSAMGQLDDLRVSRKVRYVANFKPPRTGFESRNGTPERTVLTGVAKSEKPVILSLNFENGFVPDCGPLKDTVLYKQGDVSIGAGHKGRGLQMPSTKDGMATVLAYNIGKTVDRFLGAVELHFRPNWSKPSGRRFLMDIAGIPGTGYAARIERDGRIAFVAKERGKETFIVKSTPLEWKEKGWYAIRLTWTTAAVSIYRNNKLVAQGGPVVMPSCMGSLFYIGSSAEGEPADGYLDNVRVLARNK